MKFKLQLNNQIRTYRASQAARFYNDACMSSDDEGYEYFVSGQPMNRMEALLSSRQCMDEMFNKKLLTHKRVTISQGATTLSNTKREVWVKR